MASTIISTVTATITAKATATSVADQRAASQGGIIEGENPSKYDSKNPIIIFIIQVSRSICQAPSPLTMRTGWHHHCLHPPPPFPSLQDAPTACHCGNHWRYPPWPFGLRTHTRLLGCHLSQSLHAYTFASRQCWPCALLVLGRSRSRPATPGIELEDRTECGRCWYGFAFWPGLRHRIRPVPSVQGGAWARTNQFWDLHVIRWCRDGYHGKYRPALTCPVHADKTQAFPVLCRILTELKLLQNQVGVVVLSAGVGNDVVGWVLLALCVALVNAGSGITALYVLLTAVGYVLFLVYAIRPAFLYILKRTGSTQNGPTQGVVALTVLMTLTSAFFTGIIGVHPIFGAFLIGLICPHDGGFAIKLTEKIEDLVSVFFLPLYFALSGLSTNIGLLDTGITWAYVIGVMAVAFFGKVIGGTMAARLNKMVWRESLTVGALMSCKGLVELIVLVSIVDLPEYKK